MRLTSLKCGCRTHQRTLQRTEQGVALITVLLIVAMATILTVAMMRSQYAAMQYSAGLFSQDQAWLYTQGAEDFIKELLQEDKRRDDQEGRQVDHLKEVWARPFPAFPVDGGMVYAHLQDMQGRFNLNRLWHDNAPDPAAAEIFERLLKNLDLPSSLGNALTDWIDTDTEPTGADGAEDDYYSRLATPYRVANRAIVDVSELRLVKGFTPEIIAKLSLYICALPATALININTASPVVIAALSPTLSQRTSEEFAQGRPNKGFATSAEALNEPVFNGLDSQQKGQLAAQLDVRSSFFELISDAEIAGRHSTVLSVLARGDSGTIQVISRDLGKKLILPESKDDKGELGAEDDDKAEEQLKEAAKNLL